MKSIFYLLYTYINSSNLTRGRSIVTYYWVIRNINKRIGNCFVCLCLIHPIPGIEPGGRMRCAVMPKKVYLLLRILYIVRWKNPEFSNPYKKNSTSPKYWLTNHLFILCGATVIFTILAISGTVLTVASHKSWHWEKVDAGLITPSGLWLVMRRCCLNVKTREVFSAVF